MSTTPRSRRGAFLLGGALLALSACNDLDMDLRNNGSGIDTSQAAQSATAPRPKADARGVISYPTYQVVVARPGDTVSTIATRIDLPADELARYNGIGTSAPLRSGEIIALPRRVAEPTTSSVIRPAEPVDVGSLASQAIDRADTAKPQPTTTPPETEPLRHRVKRGETAYTIARLYRVSIRALADWNGLGPDLMVREGQYLLIPVAQTNAPIAVEEIPEPGEGSPTPTPPSAGTPLPQEETKPAAEALASKPASPNLSQEQTSKTRLAMPANGKIIRPYKKGSNEGIDIAASTGSAVHAAEAGTVAAITRDTDQVPILVLRHADNLLTVYANIDKITVKKGDSVNRGQKVAVVRGGEPSFLHFEVRQGFESTDPVPFLN